jgi:hypothetical protein
LSTSTPSPSDPATTTEIRVARRPRWATAELIDTIRAVNSRLGHPPTCADYTRWRRADEPAPSTVLKAFSTWSAALVAAGLDHSHVQRRRRWHRDDVDAAVSSWLATATDRRHAAYRDAARADPSLPSPEALARHYTTWRRAVEALGPGQ